jgi:hypothetical protein
MTEAMFPFENEEDLLSSWNNSADKGVPSSFWEDEIDERGRIMREESLGHGATDMRDWGVAMQAAFEDVSTGDFEGAVNEGSDEAIPESDELTRGIESQEAEDVVEEGEKGEGGQEDGEDAGGSLDTLRTLQYVSGGTEPFGEVGRMNLSGIEIESREDALTLNEIAAESLTEVALEEQVRSLLLLRIYSWGICMQRLLALIVGHTALSNNLMDGD